jgi:peroxiredoxin (alkyl hydroperoxide reductase subunit C)
MSVLVGRSAPDFDAAAVLASGEIVDNFVLSEAIKGKKSSYIFLPTRFYFCMPIRVISF